MVDRDPHPGPVEQWAQGQQLVVDHLHVGDHVQLGQRGQLRAGVGVVLDAEQRRVQRHAQHAGRPQPDQGRATQPDGHDGEATEPTGVGGQ